MDDEAIKAGNDRIEKLEAENKKLRDEFDAQRAKMKELYLQKESECRKMTGEMTALKKELDEAKSQIVLAEYRNENSIQTTERKAQEEIASLQHLIHETIEESSVSKSELEKLYHEYERIKGENIELRETLAQQHHESPVNLPVLTKIARKLGVDSGNSDLEDSMRKAQEDAEVLRSLVVPLEEEIKALKEKLRATDDELQKQNKKPVQSALVGILNESSVDTTTKQILSAPQTTDESMETMSDSVNPNKPSEVSQPCEMCHNYETHLIQSQDSLREERQKIVSAEKSIERLKEELQREAELRQDLETQWQEKRDMHKEEVQILSTQLKNTEKEFADLIRSFHDARKEINDQMMRMTEKREQVNRHLENLQRDNDILSGKYIAHSQALQNQEINLPSTVEELQEMLLSTHENLIEAKIGCEHAEQEMLSMRDESQLLRVQLREQNRDSNARIHHLEEIQNSQKIELQKFVAMKEDFDKRDGEFKKVSSELREQVIELREANDKLEKANMDLRNKMTVLQQDLSNSEAVQKDFVRLSQSLQMELEKIRAADVQVRWQDEEDIDQCNNCKTVFTVTRRKQHCRHCGTIYCEKCLTKTVPSSGRSNKLARVCDVCHTLLVRNTAPYFSQAPPHSP